MQSRGLRNVISLDQKKMATDPCPKEAVIDRARVAGHTLSKPHRQQIQIIIMNKYEIIGIVGEGAYGIVYKAKNKATG